MSGASPGREALVIDTFITLADTLAGDYDVSELLHVLVDRCGEVLRAATAGVVLESHEGGLRLAAAMTEEMEAVEEAEMAAGSGPCVDAYRSKEPVVVPDLSACEERWPDLVPRLLAMGMRAGHAFPLRLREDCIGALNLYRRQPGEFDEDDIRLAQSFADIAAIGILQHRTVAEAELRVAQLQHALDSRVVIEQAKGVLAQRHRVTVGEAFAELRRHARDGNRKIHDLAREVVEGAIDVSPGSRAR
jgi:GAF domain-containing protein